MSRAFMQPDMPVACCGGGAAPAQPGSPAVREQQGAGPAPGGCLRGGGWGRGWRCCGGGWPQAAPLSGADDPRPEPPARPVAGQWVRPRLGRREPVAAPSRERRLSGRWRRWRWWWLPRPHRSDRAPPADRPRVCRRVGLPAGSGGVPLPPLDSLILDPSRCDALRARTCPDGSRPRSVDLRRNGARIRRLTR